MGEKPTVELFSEVSPFTSTRDLKTDRLDQCEVVAQTLSEENDRLKGEVEMLKAKMEAIHEIDETESDESNGKGKILLREVANGPAMDSKESHGGEYGLRDGNLAELTSFLLSILKTSIFLKDFCLRNLHDILRK